MMSTWGTYPKTYRQSEVQHILQAVQAGECAAIVGLSGSGKSNLLGFIANRLDVFPHQTILIDCNRLPEVTPVNLYRLVRRGLGETQSVDNEFEALDGALAGRLAGKEGGTLSLLFDRFDLLTDNQAIASNLRALRDAYKYQLTYVTATRHPPPQENELAELFFGHILWLGTMSESDTRWNIGRYAQRVGADWDEMITQKMLEISGGYPSLLRGVCEAYAGGADLKISELRQHPAIRRRLDEFWADDPKETEIQNAGADGLLLLERGSGEPGIDLSQLTEKEYLLLTYLQEHLGEVCTKDDLVRAVWPEDVIYARGVRDDSLAQLVRRLRVKIEPDPSSPCRILTVPGRGYRFMDLHP